MTPIDQAIQKLDDKISVLTLAKQELIAVRDDSPAPDAPKVRKARRKKGLPSSVPPASEANFGAAK